MDCLRIGFGHANLPQGICEMRAWLARTGR
jgi:hypothetical protein